MGFFSQKHKVKVYSAIFNMAGDKPINYIGSALGMYAVGNQNHSITEQIQGALLKGPAMKLRGWARWCRQTNYRGKIGISAPRLRLGDNIDLDLIRGQLPAPPVGGSIVIQTALIDLPDYSAWVDEWLAINHPEDLDAEFISDIDDAGQIVTLTFPDDRPPYIFPIVGYDMNAMYLYVTYMEVGKDSAGPIDYGVLTDVVSPLDWPPTTGMDPVDVANTPLDRKLKTTTTTTVVYSDGRPGSEDVVVTERDAPYTQTDNTYDSVEFIGSNPAGDETNSLRRILLLRQTQKVTVAHTENSDIEYLPGGVTKTTTVAVDRENHANGYQYRQDTQIITNRKWSQQKVFKYAAGSGNAVLDNMFNASTSNDQFYPMIPFKSQIAWIADYRKKQNTWLPPYPYSYEYPTVKEAYKRLADGDFEKKTKEIAATMGNGPEDPTAVGVFIIPAVAINTKSKQSQKYLYEFFETMADNSAGSIGKYNAWRVSWNAADVSQQAWIKWRDAQAVPTDPLFGTSEPARLAYPPSPGYGIEISSPTQLYRQTLTWSAISVDTGTGLGWTGAKVGAIQVKPGLSEEYYESVTSGGVTQLIPGFRDVFTISRQLTADSWKTLTVYDLVNTNRIYSGKSVVTRSGEAFSKSDPMLLIPLQERIYNNTSLVDASQMCLDNSYLMINSVFSYTTGGGGFGLIIIAIIVVVITVMTAGGGSLTGPGLLGTAASVGGALGFTGYVAILVGSVANAIAAMVLAKLITMGAQALFGERIGAVVGMIASVIAINYGTSYTNGTAFSVTDVMTSPETLMKLSIAAGKGYSDLVTSKAADTLAASQDYMKSYENEMTQVQDKWTELLGDGQVIIDPLAMLDISQPDAYVAESADSFLGRTLLTGTDIAQMTIDIISNFASVTVNTDLPT